MRLMWKDNAFYQLHLEADALSILGGNVQKAGTLFFLIHFLL